MCSATHAAAGSAFFLSSFLPPSLSPTPECGGTAFFCAARLPPDLLAWVSGDRGRLLRGVCVGCSLFFFGRPLLRARHCLFLATLFVGHSGSPKSLNKSRPPPPEPHPTRRPGSPARPIRASSRPPWRFLPAFFPRARPGPRVGGVGPRPLGSWSLLCSRPAPPGEGRRMGSGGRTREA